MDSKAIREKTKQNMEKIFSGKVLAAVKTELDARQEVRDIRKSLKETAGGYRIKIAATKQIITELQSQVDGAFTAGREAKEPLRELATKTEEMNAYQRLLDRLAVEDGEAAINEKATEKSLSDALRRAFFALRDDLAEKVEAQLKDILFTVAFFEQAGFSLLKEHGVEIGIDAERQFGRFLGCSKVMADLEPFCEPVGEVDAAAFRRFVREKLMEE